MDLDPTLNPVTFLDSRACLNCLEDGCRSQHRCPSDLRLCLYCFHRHARSVPCSCDCKHRTVYENWPKDRLNAVRRWDRKCRRDVPESDQPFLHPPPDFVVMLLESRDINVQLFAEKAFCRICLMSTHKTENCDKIYTCLRCFHEHLSIDCRCDCLRLRVKKFHGVKIDLEELEELEELN